MSRRDCRSNVRLNADSLKTSLEWLLTCCVWPDVKWRTDCTWVSPMLLSATALLWAWSDESRVVDRFSTARKIVLHLFSPRKVVGKTYQGFIKLLCCWTNKLVDPIVLTLRKQTQIVCRKHMEVAGFILFAIDGSRIELPRTQTHEQVFSSKKKRHQANKSANKKGTKNKTNRARRPKTSANTKKSEKPAMWITTLWHVGSGLPWDWRLGATDSSERGHWMEMLSSITMPAMFVGDAGFVGYEYASAVLSAGHQLTIRVGSHVSLLKNLGYVRESNDIVYVWPDKSAKRQRLAPLVFRLVESHNGKHPVYLITSVTSKSKLSNTQVLSIYKSRWGIELFYRHLKQTFNKRKLRCTAPKQAYVEMQWAQLGLWCMGLYTVKELIAAGIDPKRLSFAKLIHAFRRTMRDYLHPKIEGECLHSLLRKSVKDDYERGDKTSREYPQKKKEKPPGKPKIQIANTTQRQLASEIKAQLRFTA